jgi:ABC-type lipoprotein release transport system permease subunit
VEGWLTDYLGLGLRDGESSGIEGELSVGVLAVTIVPAILACLLGALIPSWQAARMEPVETLQVTQL